MKNKMLLSLVLAGASAQAGGFAAIAYSPREHSWSEFHGANSRWGAERRALADCYGYDCRVAAWVTNGYAVLATHYRGNGHYGVGISPNFEQAKRLALQNCGRFCQLTAWTSAFSSPLPQP